jgi:DNA polymerase I
MTGWNINLPGTTYFELGKIQNTPGEAEKFQTFWNEVAGQPTLAIDSETTGLVTWKDIPLYWSLAWKDRRATLHANLLPYFLPTFADPTKRWIFANAKYDAHIFSNVGLDIAGKLVDICVQHALLYEDKPHGLKYVTQHLHGWTYGDFQDQFGKIGKKQSAEDVIRRAERENMGLLIEYAANDAWATWCCYEELCAQLKSAVTHSLFRTMPPYIETLWDLFEKVEVPYTKCLWRMERAGIKVDRKHLEAAEPAAQAEIDRIEKEINRLAGYVLNPGSNKQLQNYFFEEQKMQPVGWTKGGKSGVRQPSTDSKFLEHYKNEHPMAKLVLEHREYSKLHGTYIVGLHEMLDPHDRIHTRFNQDVARTGRLSSSDPNLQNIPKPENDKWNLRSAFIPEPGNKILCFDYNQLEMRLLAAAALERDMIEVFARKWDIHMGNAALMFNVPYDDMKAAKSTEKKVKEGELPQSAMTDYVVKCLEYRAAAKNIGFGLNYGMGAAKLARALGCSVDEAQKKIDQYKATYPAVTQFYQEAVAETEKTGYAFTILGRRRNVAEIASHRHDERALGERVAINTQIQGSAADVCKMAQINLMKVDLESRYGCRMLLQVHDELVFECPEENCKEAMEEITDLMEHPFTVDLAVHLAVEAGHGASWGASK